MVSTEPLLFLLPALVELSWVLNSFQGFCIELEIFWMKAPSSCSYLELHLPHLTVCQNDTVQRFLYNYIVIRMEQRILLTMNMLFLW
jgi:hypothetical protein